MPQKTTCLLSIAVLFMASLMASTANSETIHAAGIVYCPYICDPNRGDSGQEGFMVEIAKRIFQAAGHSYEVTFYPFKRALKLVRQGTYDALAICNKADLPKGGLIFPETPMGMVKNAFALRKEADWSYQGVASLKKIKIGTVLGYTFKDEALNQYLKTTGSPAVQRIGGADVTRQNIRKLLAGRIDAYIDDVNVIRRVASQMGVADQIKLVGDVDNTPHYIGFPPDKEQSIRYAEILSKGMEKLRKTGELEKILSKYGVVDWEK